MTLFIPNKNITIPLAGLLVILLAVVFCMWPGMHSPLFADDVHQLAKSKEIVKWTEVFSIDVFGYYRPVKNALFKLAAPFENHLVAWHWIGLIAYLGATVGVFRIATICLGTGLAAWLATCFWALSPSCVSTGVWLSCANISIGIIFGACMFHFHERWADRSSLGLLVACGVFFALALVCYESLIAVPALLFIRDFQQRRLSFSRQTLIRYGTYTLVALAFLIVRHEFAARAIGEANLHPGFEPNTKAIHMTLSAPWFLWRHFLMWVFPFGTIEILGSYWWLRSASVASLAFGWVFFGALLVSAAMTWKRFPAVAFGLLFFFVASLPSGNFIPCYNGPIYDAYVTIPSIGLAIALAKICELLIYQFKSRRKASESGSIAIMMVLALLLIYRLPVCGAYFRYWAGVWANPVELLLLTTETRPLQTQAKGYVTILLLNGGYIDHAELLANEVISEAPWDPTAKMAIARIAIYRKDLLKAEKYFRLILDSPRSPPFLKNPARFELAEILENNPARRDEVTQLLREFLVSRKTADHPKAIAMLSRIYKEQGDIPKARATLERGLSLYPNNKRLTKILETIDQPTPAQRTN